MSNHTTPSARLKALILEAEIAKRRQEEELKEEIKMTLERLRPSQLIKRAFNEFVHAPDFKKDALNTTIGLATGFVSRKIVVGRHGGFLRKILGTIIQIGVSAIVGKATKNVGKKLNAASHAAENKGTSDPAKNEEGPEGYLKNI